MGPRSNRREERFERLYRAHVDAVYRYAVRRHSDGPDDIVADVFLTAWRKLPDIPPGAELGWLLGVARRHDANARRGARRRRALAERLGLARAADDGTHDGSPTSLAPDVESALACLQARDQELLALVAWDGLDNDGVAAAMGCSRANVAVRLHRARKRFARELARVQEGAENPATRDREGRYV